jgi:hypothetical protein
MHRSSGPSTTVAQRRLSGHEPLHELPRNPHCRAVDVVVLEVATVDDVVGGGGLVLVVVGGGWLVLVVGGGG